LIFLGEKWYIEDGGASGASDGRRRFIPVYSPYVVGDNAYHAAHYRVVLPANHRNTLHDGLYIQETSMNVFISYAHPDKPFADRLTAALEDEGIEVWRQAFDLKAGDNWIKVVDEGLRESDYIIIVLSPAYYESQWVKREYQAFAVREVTEGRTSILPVLVADAEIPAFLRDRQYADFRTSFEDGFQRLLSALRGEADRSVEEARILSRQRKETTIDLQVHKIKKEYDAGNLCLFCGAGISLEAGIPVWAKLLKSLLAVLYEMSG